MGMTGYIDKRLKRTGERIIYRAHLSWVPLFLTAIPMTWIVSMLAGAVMGMTGNAGYTVMTIIIGIILIVISKIPGVLKNIGTDIVVTDRRLHSKTGIIDVDNDHETPLTNINNTVADPTVIGRLFGYGDVVIQTIGGNDDFTFRNVSNPNELVAIINETYDGLIAGGQNPYAAFQQSQQQNAPNDRNRFRKF